MSTMTSIFSPKFGYSERLALVGVVSTIVSKPTKSAPTVPWAEESIDRVLGLFQSTLALSLRHSVTHLDRLLHRLHNLKDQELLRCTIDRVRFSKE